MPKPRGRPKKSVSEPMPVEALKPTETKSVRTRRPSVQRQVEEDLPAQSNISVESDITMPKKKDEKGLVI